MTDESKHVSLSLSLSGSGAKPLETGEMGGGGVGGSQRKQVWCLAGTSQLVFIRRPDSPLFCCPLSLADGVLSPDLSTVPH